MFARTRTAVHLLLATLLLRPVLAVPEPNTVGFKFHKRQASPEQKSSSIIAKRQNGAFSAELSNVEIAYLINVTIGTPGQPFSLQLDTGSTDLWVPWANSEWCLGGELYCPYGDFNENSSTTYQEVTEWGEFFISYADGTYVDGIYFNDTINIGSTSVTGASMALGQFVARGLGIMGIGFTENESSNDPAREQVGLSAPFTYPSIMDNLVAQGHITSHSYSLWLDDLNDDVGTILFGGVDTERYVGDLVSLPIQNDANSGAITSFTIAWTGLTVNTGGSSSNTLDFSPSTPQPVVLDSGSTVSYLPDAIAEDLYNGLGVITDPYVGNVLPCNTIANNISFTYTFGGRDTTSGASITVPLSEIMLPLINFTTNEPYRETPNGPDLCQFGIEKAGPENLLIFGDTFLRSAYVVYDLANQQIALAQTNFRSDASNTDVTEISSDAAIPNVASTASQASVAQTYTGDLPLNTDAGTDTAFPTDFGAGDSSTTVSRSATFPLSTTGTVPPSATETGTGAGAATRSRTTGSGSGTASATSSAASASATGVAARVGGSAYKDVLISSLLVMALSGWGWALMR